MMRMTARYDAATITTFSLTQQQRCARDKNQKTLGGVTAAGFGPLVKRCRPKSEYGMYVWYSLARGALEVLAASSPVL